MPGLAILMSFFAAPSRVFQWTMAQGWRIRLSAPPSKTNGGMNMIGKRIQIAMALVTMVLAAPALAQNQPWNTPAGDREGAVESRIVSCTDFTPINKVAMDDFQYDQTTKITWIRWWGVVFDNAQLTKPFYIAIWSNGMGPCPAPCNPQTVLVRYCLNPSRRYVGLDCNNRRVYRFSVGLPAPFFALGGTKYWLQISEPDQESARPGVEDFRWSAYKPITLCPAQRRGGGVIDCAIADDCPNPSSVDLSYVLSSTCLGGVIILPPIILPPAVFLAEIRPSGLPMMDPIDVHTVELDDDGQYYIDHGLPDGNYDVTLVGMCTPHPTQQVMIQNGVGGLSFFDVFVGDLNNTGSADGLDLQLMVDGLLGLP